KSVAGDGVIRSPGDAAGSAAGSGDAEDSSAGHGRRGPVPLALDEFERRFGRLDTTRAVHAFTIPADTHIVLTLLAQARPQRILEIGTAAGHMTANFTEWSADDSTVFT